MVLWNEHSNIVITSKCLLSMITVLSVYMLSNELINKYTRQIRLDIKINVVFHSFVRVIIDCRGQKVMYLLLVISALSSAEYLGFHGEGQVFSGH